MVGATLALGLAVPVVGAADSEDKRTNITPAKFAAETQHWVSATEFGRSGGPHRRPRRSL